MKPILFIQRKNNKKTYHFYAVEVSGRDADKNITAISYNYLNKPELIDLTSGNKIQYTYDATGAKLAKKVLAGSAVTGGTYYLGNFVYNQNGVLQYILTSEGRLVPTGNTYRYEYFMKDHLGNTRATYAAAAPGLPQVMEYQHYYPFGMQLEALGYTSGADLKNNYLYNGKELQEDYSLNWYDYGARMYDPVIGRFTTQDAYAEKYASLTPYQYGANNPIKYIDINGDSLWVTHRTGFLGLGGKETLRYEDGSLYNKDGSAYTGKVKGFLGKAVNALNEASSGNAGDNMINELQSSTQNVTVVKSSDGNSYESNINTVKFDPSSQNGGLNTRGLTERPTFIGLGHELAHGLDDVRGTLNLKRIPGQTFTYAEHFATDMENKMRAEHGLPLRTHYGINAAGAGVYPLIDASGNSLHSGGHHYYDAFKMTPKRALIPATTIISNP